MWSISSVPHSCMLDCVQNCCLQCSDSHMMICFISGKMKCVLTASSFINGLIWKVIAIFVAEIRGLEGFLNFQKWFRHEFHETCHSVTFIVLVNSHQRWKKTRNRVCFHLWCELTTTMNITEWQVSWNSWKLQSQLNRWISPRILAN